MATSTIPAFKTALKARLVADSNITAAGCQVSRGMPVSEPQYELIYLGSARTGDPTRDSKYGAGQMAAAMNPITHPQEERYTLDVIVSVLDDVNQEYEVIETRAYLIASWIENSIRTWGLGSPKFDSIVRMAGVYKTDGDEFLNDRKNMREARVTVGVYAHARI